MEINVLWIADVKMMVNVIRIVVIVNVHLDGQDQYVPITVLKELMGKTVKNHASAIRMLLAII